MGNTENTLKLAALRAHIQKAIEQGGAYTDEEIEEMLRAETALKNA